MKTKFSKILGVGLTLVMVLALTAGFALPVGASPGENEWSKLLYPAEGELGDWFYYPDIKDGPGPIAKAIDGTLYAYAEIDTNGFELLKSTDGGRSWALTYYSDALPPTGVGVEGGAIVAIACSSLDADIVYVADADNVYKTADAGDTFAAVANASLPTAELVAEDITSLAVGYLADDSPFVFFGTEDGTDTTGHIYYLNEEAYGASWTDLEIADYDVFGLGCSPDFAHDTLVVAVGASTTQTFVGNNYGVVGDWDYVELEDEDEGSYAITEASDPAFPEDFDEDDAYEFFVGVVGEAHTDDPYNGGVYRVYDGTSDLCSYVDADIISLDLVGEVGDTMLLAGVDDVADVWWSTNDGDNWKNAIDYGLPPTGGGPTYVVMDDDFATNDTAWAATDGTESAVSLSVDGGEIWHGISLIRTDITEVRGVALSTAYATDETLFLLTHGTTESLFKYDGANWERVFESTLYDTLYTAPQEADLVAVSPDFATDETVFVGYTADGTIFRSTDAGISFVKQRVEPTALTYWAIIDSDTIIAGGNGEVHKTENYGRRTWASYAVVGAGNIVLFAVAGETIILGDATGLVFVSEDAGEEWEQVGDTRAYLDFTTTDSVLVAFDGAIIYAASGDVVGRCVIDTDEDWADQTWEKIATPTVTVSQTTGADAITVELVNGAEVVTITETTGAFLVTAVGTITSTIAKTAPNVWTVTGAGVGAAGEKVLVTAIGTVTPCSGSIAVAVGTQVDLATVTDANNNVYRPATIAAGAPAEYFVLPDVAVALADVVTPGLQAASGIVISPDGTLYVVDATASVGVWRSLNPDAELVADVVSEAITYKLAATATLALAGFSVGSNVLWATDGALATNLWTYEDGLATEVILSSPVSGSAVTDTDKATLGWFELTGAEEYDIDVNTRDDFLTSTAIAVADVEETWVTVDGLDAGTTYYWRVRVATGDPLLSRYSETRTFITALEKVTPPLMWYPENGADDVVLEPVLSWGEVTGATSYKISIATEPGFAVASRLVETMIVTNFYPCDVKLSYNTTYYWRVKAFSDSVVVSDWQAGMFTTMAKPVPVVPPVEVTAPSPPSDVIVEVPPAVEVIVPAAQVISPTWIYVIIAVGALLVIAVIVLIVRTRRVS